VFALGGFLLYALAPFSAKKGGFPRVVRLKIGRRGALKLQDEHCTREKSVPRFLIMQMSYQSATRRAARRGGGDVFFL
jgi:hypothetical protein